MSDKKYFYSMEKLYNAIENDTSLSEKDFRATSDIYSEEGFIYRDISPEKWEQEKKKFKEVLTKLVDAYQKGFKTIEDQWIEDSLEGKIAKKENKTREQVTKEIKECYSFYPTKEVVDGLFSIIEGSSKNSRQPFIHLKAKELRKYTNPGFFKALTSGDRWRRAFSISESRDLLDPVEQAFYRIYETSSGGDINKNSDSYDVLNQFVVTYGVDVGSAFKEVFGFSKDVDLSIAPQIRLKKKKE